MKLWLTKCHGGRYMLTALSPKIASIRGTPHRDAFERAGEPVSARHLCEPGVLKIFGAILEPLIPTRVELHGTIL
jgi:hypothetical protein